MNTFQKKFSLVLSVLVTLLACALLFFISLRKGTDFAWKDEGMFSFAFFLSAYSLITFSTNNFIFKRLVEILGSILRYRNRSETITNYPQGENVIAAIEEEIKEWAEDKKNEADRLKKLELYRKEYIGNVSHELKTPTFNIQGYILTLLDGGLEDPKVNREYLLRAEKSVDRMINIIEDLESISQLETGELTLDPERFDIVALTKDICEGQEMKAASKGIIFSIKKDEPVFVVADRFRIRQVLTNLIVNSVKYGKEYGETIIQFMENPLGENNDHVKIEVADNGIGISPEHLPRLFERFYRIDKSRSRDQGGTGLGLSIVKHILEAHGQNMNVSSVAGEGATFSFMLKKG